MNKVTCLLLISFILIFSIDAQIPPPVPPTPPRWVYRVDERRPGIITEWGFVPWGGNQNLAQHATGESCTSCFRGMMQNNPLRRTSNFISTTSIEYQEASGRGVDAVLRASVWDYHRTGTIFYVYQIRPNENFYELNFSCASYAANNPDLNADQQRQLTHIFETDAPIREWCAEDGIPNTLVHSVTEFILHFDEDQQPYFEMGLSYSNTNYTEMEPQANTQPYPTIFPSPDETAEVAAAGDDRFLVLLQMTRSFRERHGVAPGFAAGASSHSSHSSFKRAAETEGECDNSLLSFSPRAAWSALRMKMY